ncbi:hypothetical protein GQ54DRAFT_303271 [Martensiomyces pterosporus]|nr:hypothetical protein GQ54DRAFT_303271 [Martensiomyces pterosporus]
MLSSQGKAAISGGHALLAQAPTLAHAAANHRAPECKTMMRPHPIGQLLAEWGPPSPRKHPTPVSLAMRSSRDSDLIMSPISVIGAGSGSLEPTILSAAAAACGPSWNRKTGTSPIFVGLASKAAAAGGNPLPQPTQRGPWVLVACMHPDSIFIVPGAVRGGFAGAVVLLGAPQTSAAGRKKQNFVQSGRIAAAE